MNFKHEVYRSNEVKPNDGEKVLVVHELSNGRIDWMEAYYYDPDANGNGEFCGDRCEVCVGWDRVKYWIRIHAA